MKTDISLLISLRSQGHRMLGRVSPTLFDVFPEGEEEVAYQYSSGRILLVTLSLFQRTKDKYVVIIDEQEPPLFFIISSVAYGAFNDRCLELRKTDYPFFTNDISYLNYKKVASTYDFIDERIPTKAQLIEQLRQDPSRIKGYLRKEDARTILIEIQDRPTDIERRDKRRIIKAFGDHINDR